MQGSSRVASRPRGAQREAAAARRLDVLMLALPRTDPRRHTWLEAGDAAQIAGRWLASHPSERLGLGLVCSCSEFSEMLVSYLGVDSPAASSPGVLGASFSGYSCGRQRFVVDAGGWEVERVQMPGDGLHFADRLRAGAGRRSGSGWRQGRVRWGWPLLSRPRGRSTPGLRLLSRPRLRSSR